MRELRTLLAMISELPLHLGIVHDFEALLRDCDQRYNGTRPSVDPVEFETHYDPNLVSAGSSIYPPPLYIPPPPVTGCGGVLGVGV